MNRKYSRTVGLSFAIVLLLAAGLTGCRKKAAAPPPVVAPPPAPAAVVEQKPEPPALPPSVLVKDIGLLTPESVLYDEIDDIYLVSNINGKPDEKDDNGFISRVAPDGTVQSLKWIDGKRADINLNAPKGMAIAKGKLYVADIDFVRIFDLKKGKPLGKIGTPLATFLNGVAAGPDGTIYMSDTGVKVGAGGFEPSGTDAVYQTDKNGQAKALLKDPSLHGPNGVFVDDSGVWVCSYGSKELYQIAQGKKENVVELPGGGLDGLVRLPNGVLLVSSWETSSIYQGKDGKFTALVSNVKAPAGFGYDSKRAQVIVPLFMDNALMIQPLPEALTAPAVAPVSPAEPSAVEPPAAAPVSAPAK